MVHNEGTEAQQTPTAVGGVPVGPPLPATTPPLPAANPPKAVQPGRQGSPVPAPRDPSGSGLLMTLSIVTGIAVVGLLGVIGYLVVSRDDGTAVAQPPASTAPATETNAAAGTDPVTRSKPAAGADEAATDDVEYEIPEFSMNPDFSNLTPKQREAAELMQSQMEGNPMGRREAITLLMSLNDEAFSEADATAAVDALGVDWVASAKAAAVAMLNFSGHSKQGLINYLTGSYTREEATQAVEGLDNVDWSAQPERYAREHAEAGAISRHDLLGSMTDPNGGAFEQAEAEKGIDGAKIDFNAEAVEAAHEWIDYFPDEDDCESVTHILQSGDFTPDEIQHAVSEVGVC